VASIAWISDLSPQSPDKAALWFTFKELFPEHNLIDLASAAEPFNMKQAAYLVLSLLKNMPKGSFILCGIKNNTILSHKNIQGPTVDNTRHLWVEINDIHLITPDNGLVGLLDESFREPARTLFYESSNQNVFFLKNIYPQAVEKILSGKTDEFGPPVDDYYKGRLLAAYKQGNMITTRLFLQDHYGNLIFNLKKKDFLEWTKGHSFEILLPSKTGPSMIHSDYEDVPPGNIFALFNDLEYLEIGINGDNLYQKMFSDKFFAQHDYELKIHLK
jgi:S-adenosylmethionine hydrolase